MSTYADLPPSTRIMGNPSGNGGFTGGADPGGREETITFAVDWEERRAFEAALRGFRVTLPIPGGSITRTIPLESPYTGGMYANAYRWKCQGKRDTSQSRPYRTVIFQVTFGYLPYSTAGDGAYQSIEAQGASKQITDQSRRYKFVGNDEEVDHGVAINFPGATYVLSVFQIPDIDAFDETMRRLMKTPVNDAELTIAGRTFGEGEVLLETYSSTSTRSLLGVQEHTARVILNWSSLKWNFAVRSDGVVDELDPPPYETGNLGEIVGQDGDGEDPPIDDPLGGGYDFGEGGGEV